MPGSLPQGHSWDGIKSFFNLHFGRDQNHGILVKIWLTDTYRSTRNSYGKTWKNTCVLINPEPIPKYSNPIKITWTIFMFDHFWRLEPPHYSLDLSHLKSPFGFSSIFVWDFPEKNQPFVGIPQYHRGEFHGLWRDGSGNCTCFRGCGLRGQKSSNISGLS